MPHFMKKFIILLGFLVLAGMLAGFKNPKPKNVAIIVSNDVPSYKEALDGFIQMHPSFTYTVYPIGGSEKKWAATYRILTETKPDLLLAIGAMGAQLANTTIKDIPIVFCMVNDPQESGLQTGNITGITLKVPVEVQLKTIRFVFPQAKKVGVIYNPKNTEKIIQEGGEYGRKAELKILPVKVDTKEDVPRALRSLKSIDIIWLVMDSTVISPKALNAIFDFAKTNQIPIMADTEEFVEDGALYATSINYQKIGQQAFKLVQQILSQSRTLKEIPITPPEGLEITYNIAVVKNLNKPEIVKNIVTFAKQFGYEIKRVER